MKRTHFLTGLTSNPVLAPAFGPVFGLIFGLVYGLLLPPALLHAQAGTEAARGVVTR